MAYQVQTPQGLKPVPRVGSWWMHHNGLVYQVFAVTNLSDRQAAYPAMVCYRGPNGKEWSKTVATWYEKMTPVADAIWKQLVAMTGQELTLAKLAPVLTLLHSLSVETSTSPDETSTELVTL